MILGAVTINREVDSFPFNAVFLAESSGTLSYLTQHLHNSVNFLTCQQHYIRMLPN